MSASRSFLALALLAAVGAATACLDDSVTGTRPLVFSMSADPVTAEIAEPVTFTFTAEGTNIVAVVVDFGDGMADTLTNPPAVMVTDFTVHSYEEAGLYTAVGKVVAQNGTLSDEVEVTVN